MMTNLAKRHRVLFIETATFSPLGFIESISAVSTKASSAQMVAENLWVLSLHNPLPFQETALRKGIQIVKWINDRACLYQIIKSLKYLNFTNAILLWVYFTSRTAYLLNKLQSDLIVCDVYDKYTEYATVDAWQKKYIVEQEKYIFRNSDLVLAVSKPLLGYCQRYNANCYLVPNAVDENFFKTSTENINIPDDLSSIRHPRIGYVGGIFDKLDYKLLTKIIEERKEYSFVFIGPVRLIGNLKIRQFEELRRHSNTFWLGPKEVRQLPQYYKGLDVCIAPYENSLQVNWSNILKAWETMATGKIFVSSIDRVDNAEASKLILVAIIAMSLLRKSTMP